MKGLIYPLTIIDFHTALNIVLYMYLYMRGRLRIFGGGVQNPDPSSDLVSNIQTYFQTFAPRVYTNFQTFRPG